MGIGCSEPIDFDSEVELRHFELQRSVGKGAFGKVRIVKKKDDKKVYALKYINKLKCINMKAVNHIIQERRLLEEVRHPFIVNLRYAFQDDDNLFMVLDLMLGGDLRFHLERSGPLKENIVRFYVAEIGLALNYLHKKRIVHRDLKPDNILLDKYGHAHLTDFNIAVRYTEGKPLRSVAGSMVYMAPEVVGKKGYYTSPDFWSLGVTMFELLYGKRPFRGKTNEQLVSAITSGSMRANPSTSISLSEPCSEVITGLLTRNVEERLGCGEKNWAKFRSSKFFETELDGEGPIMWNDLEQRKVIPPFIPDNNRSNFDASHELEELLLEDNPLRVKKRKKNIDYNRLPGGEDGEVARQMKLMEKKFTVFDYNSVDFEENENMNMEIDKTIRVSRAKSPGVRKPKERKIIRDPQESSMQDLKNFRESDRVPQSSPSVAI